MCAIARTQRKERRTAVGLGRVQVRSQVTIPAEVREALEIRPGDVLMFEVIGPEAGQFRILRTTRPLDEFFEAYRVNGPVPADLWDTVASTWLVTTHRRTLRRLHTGSSRRSVSADRA